MINLHIPKQLKAQPPNDLEIGKIFMDKVTQVTMVLTDIAIACTL
jgi:hypothetical protein